MVSLNLCINVDIKCGVSIMAKITDRRAQSIKPGDKAKPTGITGFTLLPTKTKGRGRWRLRYVSPVTQTRRDYSIGSYPDVSVAIALKAARDARDLIAIGKDPLEERKAINLVPTFKDAALRRWEEKKHTFKSDRTRTDWLKSLELHIFPGIGLRKVDTLKPVDFAKVLQPLYNSTTDMCRKVKERCNDIMGWCWAHEYTDGNPLSVVDKLLAKKEHVTQHHPAVPWSDVWEFVQKHLSKKPRTGAKACLLFLIFTATRSSEARGAKWDEIDFKNKLWTIPAERMKKSRPHRVPLSDAALALLGEQKEYSLHDDLIFPSAQGKHLSDMALLNILRKAKVPSDTPERLATVHGFRSSFRNWSADNGYSTDISERALAHAIGNAVQAAYERTDRLEARVDMMQAWADVVMADRSNVTVLRRAG